MQLEEKGPYHDALLTVTTDVLRIACAATPRMDLQEIPTSPPTLGRFVDAKDWFVGLISGWLQQRPSVKRLAFNAKLIRYADNRDALYHMLNIYLHDVEVDPKSADLLYRINRKRPSRAMLPVELEINRLSTWAAMKFTIAVQGVMASGETTPTFPTTVDRMACVMELDINTDQDFSGPLNPDQLPQVFVELVSLGTEIAECGDVE
ncbi:MAG TPA: hypothetical protein DDY78_24360 [Planctomycetales bacterium]|jgi:hypothetical protein|nr:hypothetical protein [Planctomycetales bacterium]